MQSTKEATLTLMTTNLNKPFKFSLRELETEMTELKSFVLELCFRKQSANINSGYQLPTTSDDNNRELVKTLLDQIEYLKKELPHKNTIISCLLKNEKPLSISDQKQSDNSNSSKVIKNSSQNRNQDSNVA